LIESRACHLSSEGEVKASRQRELAGAYDLQSISRAQHLSIGGKPIRRGG
jgi:hypothetical protein